MKYVISIEHDRLIFLKGFFRGGKIRLKVYDQEPFDPKPAGSGEKKKALSVLSLRNHIKGKEVILVFSGKASVFREGYVPAVKSKKQERELIMNEMTIHNPGLREYATDYLVIGKNINDNTEHCVVQGIMNRTISDSLEALKHEGIRCKRIETRPNCKAKLVRTVYPQEALSILIDIYRNHMNLTLLSGNCCVIARAVSYDPSLASDGTDGLLAEASDQINKMIQFNAARHVDEQVKRILVSGIVRNDSEFIEKLRNEISQAQPGGLECVSMKPEKNIDVSGGKEIPDCMGCIGSLIPSDIDLNFYDAYKLKDRKEVHVTHLKRRILIAAVVLEAAAVVLLTAKAKKEAAAYRGQAEEGKAYLTGSEDAAKCASLQDLNNQYLALKKKDDAGSEYEKEVKSLPSFRKEIWDKMNSLMPGGMQILSVSFDESGRVTAGMSCTSRDQVPDYIEALRNSGIFESVEYNGWNSNGEYLFETDAMLKSGGTS
jgi:hypothetical protein